MAIIVNNVGAGERLMYRVLLVDDEQIERMALAKKIDRYYGDKVNIYQAVSFDLQTENAQMLPSYIYYGVSSKEAVIVSKLGVPRFAVDNVLRVLKEKNPELPISIDNMDWLRAAINKIESTDYQVENTKGKIIKEIIDKRIKGI